MRPAPQNLSPYGTEGAVSGNTFRERRGRKRRRLIRDPFPSIHRYSPHERSSPGFYYLSMKQRRNCGGGANEIKYPRRVPGGNGSIVNGRRQYEEHLGIIAHSVV